MVTEKDVTKHFQAANDVASEIVERYARAILCKHPSLNEFVMGNGTWFFTRRDKSIIHDQDEPNYIQNSRLSRFIDEWNRELHITGQPMRFTATSLNRFD